MARKIVVHGIGAEKLEGICYRMAGKEWRMAKRDGAAQPRPRKCRGRGEQRPRWLCTPPSKHIPGSPGQTPLCQAILHNCLLHELLYPLLRLLLHPFGQLLHEWQKFSSLHVRPQHLGNNQPLSGNQIDPPKNYTQRYSHLVSGSSQPSSIAPARLRTACRSACARTACASAPWP